MNSVLPQELESDPSGVKYRATNQSYKINSEYISEKELQTIKIGIIFSDKYTQYFPFSTIRITDIFLRRLYRKLSHPYEWLKDKRP